MKDKKLVDLVAYLGPHGTFSEEATFAYFGKDAAFKMCSTNEGVVQAVAAGTVAAGVDVGIVAFENSIEGTVHATQDAIINSPNVKVAGEFILPIQQNLIGKYSDISLSKIVEVASHPQALAQCIRWLEENLNDGVRFVELAGQSTAQAVKDLHIAGRRQAAIGSKAAAEFYRKHILVEGIQDGENNETRFLVLGRTEDNPPAGQNKTSVLFEVPDVSGSLCGALQILAALEINLTFIQSRPSKRKLGEYVFWIDLDGHRGQDEVRVALKKMAEKTDSLRILGSYPKARKSVVVSPEQVAGYLR